MNRTAAHPTLRMDPDFRDFLSMDADLPKASNTSALSAAGVMRLFGKVGDAVSKMSTNMTETDSVSLILMCMSGSIDYCRCLKTGCIDASYQCPCQSYCMPVSEKQLPSHTSS